MRSFACGLLVTLSAALALGCLLGRTPQVPRRARGPEAVRILERHTGRDFGGAPPASPDVAVFELGMPAGRLQLPGDTLTLLWLLPGRQEPCEALHVAVTWAREAPAAISTW